MALPMINETREAYPGSSVTVLAPEHLIQLFESNPAIDVTLKIPVKHVHGLIGVVKIKDIIGAHHFDLGFVLPPSFGAASAFKLAGVKERVGYIADGRRLLLTRPMALPEPLNSEHRSEVYFNLLRRASGADLTYTRPKLFLSEQDVARVAELLSGFNMSIDDDYAVIAFRAVAESRRWGTDRYAALSLLLAEKHGMNVLLVGSDDDRSAGDEMAATIGHDRVINLAGKTSLRELASLCSRANLFVGNDSGPAHLAAAAGAPSVVLSGADDPKETTPLSNRKRLIRVEHLECISCVKNRCPLKGEDFMRCMKEVSVERVMGEVEAALGAS
jgi:lipopolysaccharide heptosyltransferase II